MPPSSTSCAQGACSMPSYTLSLDPSDLQHYVKATDPVAASAARMLSCSGAGRRAGAVLWTLGQQELASKAFRAVEDVSLYQGGRGQGPAMFNMARRRYQHYDASSRMLAKFTKMKLWMLS